MAITFTPGQTVATPDWEALFQQHGGSKSTVIRPMTKAEEDAALDAGDDPTQNPIYRYYAADGSYVEARKAPNGDYQIVGYQPSEKFTQTQRPPTAATGQKPTGGREVTEGTPTGQVDANGQPIYDNERPRRVVYDASGREVWSEELTGPELTAWRESRERSRNPGGKTDAQLGTANQVGTPTGNSRERTLNGTKVKETEYALPNGTTVWRTQTADGAVDQVGKPTGNTRERTDGATKIKETEYILPDGTKEWRTQTAAGAPTTKKETTPLEGNPGWEVGKRQVTDAAGNVVTETYYINPKGEETKTPPPAGAASARGPAMPTIVVGAAADALRKYHTALANDPNLTPDQRAKRFQEAVQTATIAANEAQTAQRDRESQRNADVNVATTKLNYLGSGLNNALSFVASLNDKLPIGSNLGGRAFAALMSMQMINLKRSGIENIGSAGTTAGGAPGAPAPAAPGMKLEPPVTISDAELTNPAALESRRQQIMADPIFKPEPVAPPPTPTTPPPAPPVGASAAPVPAAPPPVPPAPTPAVMPPTPIAAPPGPVDPASMGVPAPPAATPPVAPAPPVPTVTGEPAPGATDMQLPTSGLPTGAGAPVVPYNPTPGTGVPVGQMAPLPDLPALSQFQQPVPSLFATAQPAAVSGPLPPAVMRAQIGAKPPWQLSEQEYQWAMENGFENEALAIPGRTF